LAQEVLLSKSFNRLFPLCFRFFRFIQVVDIKTARPLALRAQSPGNDKGNCEMRNKRKQTETNGASESQKAILDAARASSREAEYESF
jgi:hypothetical protein